MSHSKNPRPFPLSTLALALGLISSSSVLAETDDSHLATFAGGCFWCMEPPFERQPGIDDAVSGYIGGSVEDPSYEAVTQGDTGHAEAVQFHYDPQRISYPQLLEVFWRNIDPFVEDRQFCDVGSQYRSAIFYHDEEQKRLAEASKNELEAHLGREIATQIVPADTFWEAEKYHQDYAERNPLRYKFYRYSCGRDERLEEVWGEEAGGPTFTDAD